MDEKMIRNYYRKRTTDNRYIIDSDTYWREELHPRVENLTTLKNIVETIISQRIGDNVWGFPVDEQSTPNAEQVLLSMLTDYLALVKGRRVWVYTETDGYWTIQRITSTFASALVNVFWDIGSNLMIDNYPLVADDLRARSGRTFINDKRENYHDSVNKLNTTDRKYTQHDNTRNKIAEEDVGIGSDTTDGRTTSNATTIQDNFLSPQDQGVLPSSQSADVMNRTHGFQTPDNMGVEEVKPNGNPNFTTATTNTFEGDTSTVKEGRTSTSRDFHNRVDERDYLEGNETFESGAHGEDNIGARVGNDTGHERAETLDIANVLKTFYDLFKDRLALELDNRMYPYYLNMKQARFKDHRNGREEYV